MTRTLLVLTVSGAMLLAACSGSPTQPPSGGPPPAAAGGQALFATNCGECHGEDGSGSDEAPGVLGHTPDQVKAQVRTPEGDMQAIPADKLSDPDLALIAAYVASLGGEEAHPEIEVTDEQRVHLQVAFEAIEDIEAIDREGAVTHLEQAGALAEGEVAELYEDMITAIKAQKAGNARHVLEELLGMGHGE